MFQLLKFFIQIIQCVVLYSDYGYSANCHHIPCTINQTKISNYHSCILFCDSYLCLVKKTSCLSVQLKRISQSWKPAIQSQFYSLNKSDLKNILANIYYFGQIPDRKMLMRLWKVQNLRHLFFPLIFSTAKTWVKNHRMVLDTSNKIPNHYGNPDQQSDLNSIHGEKNETMSIYPA